MIALDTNILVRYLTNDDLTLGSRAESLIRENRCFVSRVVLIETFHVLASYYELERPALQRALHVIFGLPNLIVEDHLSTARAVEWFEAGMEFPDAIVLSAAREVDLMATFDRDFARVASRLESRPPVVDVRKGLPSRE